MIDKFGTAFPAPITLLLFGLLLALAAGINILGDKNPIYYFLVFSSGFLIASDFQLQKAIDKIVWPILVFGIIAALIQIMAPHTYAEWTPGWIARGLLYEMGRWTLTLAALGLGGRFLNQNSSFLRYANKAAMPFYLLHMTFTVFTGYFVIRIDAPVGVKYLVIVLIATGLTLLAYELVRRWKVTRWLFGMRIDR